MKTGACGACALERVNQALVFERMRAGVLELVWKVACKVVPITVGPSESPSSFF